MAIPIWVSGRCHRKIIYNKRKIMDNGFEEINIGLEEVWTPEKAGDLIQGKLVEIKNSIGANNSTMYVLETSEGRKSVWDTTVLRNKMSQVNLLDEVYIKYEGEKESPKSGRTYKDFSVGVKRAK